MQTGGKCEDKPGNEAAEGLKTSSSWSSKNPWSEPALLSPPRPESDAFSLLELPPDSFEFPPDAFEPCPEFDAELRRLGAVDVFPLPFPAENPFLFWTVVLSE